jgi:hypothetical protein
VTNGQSLYWLILASCGYVLASEKLDTEIGLCFPYVKETLGEVFKTVVTVVPEHPDAWKA